MLTNGKISLDEQGVDSKQFNVLDGIGIGLLNSAGIQVGLLSGKKSEVVARRAEQLELAFYHHGVMDKRPKLDEVLQSLGLSYDESCYIGDDVIDLPCLVRVAFPVAVADARPEVKRVAAYITRARGGEGAVRETAEVLLRAQKCWGGIVERFFQ